MEFHVATTSSPRSRPNETRLISQIIPQPYPWMARQWLAAQAADSRGLYILADEARNRAPGLARRVSAIRALASLEARLSSPVLEELALRNDEDPAVRWSAMFALTSGAAPQAAACLEAVYRDPQSASIRVRANHLELDLRLWALEFLRSMPGTHPLLEAVAASVANMPDCALACAALFPFDPRRWSSVLAGILADRGASLESRECALRALLELVVNPRFAHVDWDATEVLALLASIAQDESEAASLREDAAISGASRSTSA